MREFVLALFCVAFAPFAEAQMNIPVQFMHVDRNVRGVLSLPAQPGPYATVVIVPGSGANDRDGTALLVGGYAPCLYPQLVGQTLKPYKGLGDALVAAGYAVLRYDKLEFTYANNLGVVTFDKLWLPVRSAINFLKTRPEVDTNQIVLLGHSEGSSLIPYVANGRSDVQALISLAGAMTPFDSILANQLVGFAQMCNGNVVQAQAEATQILNYYSVIRAGNPPLNTPPLFGVSAAEWRNYVLATDTVAGFYNAAAKPALFIGLGADVNVPPSELTRFQGAVTITNDFWLLPNINHLLTTNSSPAFVQQIADTIVHWLGSRGIFTSTPNLQLAIGTKAYPNPAADWMQLDFEKPLNQAGSYRVLDAAGRLHLQDQIPAGTEGIQISLATLASGMYYIEVQFEGRAKHLPLLVQKR
jgi:dienelactone hydrolase